MVNTHRAILPGRINSLALGPGGGLAAVVLDRARIAALDPSTLEVRAEFPLTEGRDGLPSGTRVIPSETHLVFLDDRVLLVSIAETLLEPDDSRALGSPFRARLLALDARTGQLLGTFEAASSVLRAPPVPIPPHHVLLSIDGLALACADVGTWREVARFGEAPEDHDPAVDIEEEIAPNGVAYDPTRGLVHVLWSYWNGAVVQSYRFHPDEPRFTSPLRHDPVEGEDAVLEANGLCVLPGGAGVAAWLAVQQACIPTAAIAGAPRTARLGRLAVFAGIGRPRFIDVASDVDRDLNPMPMAAPDPDGSRPTHEQVGIDFYDARPIALGDGRVLVNSPSGFLIAVDPALGRAEALHDFRSPIVGLELDPAEGALLVACEDRTVCRLRP